MQKILDRINKANDIKKIESREHKRLAAEIRQFLINNVSKTIEILNIFLFIINYMNKKTIKLYKINR